MAYMILMVIDCPTDSIPGPVLVGITQRTGPVNMKNTLSILRTDDDGSASSSTDILQDLHLGS